MAEKENKQALKERMDVVLPFIPQFDLTHATERLRKKELPG